MGTIMLFELCIIAGAVSEHSYALQEEPVSSVCTKVVSVTCNERQIDHDEESLLQQFAYTFDNPLGYNATADLPGVDTVNSLPIFIACAVLVPFIVVVAVGHECCLALRLHSELIFEPMTHGYVMIIIFNYISIINALDSLAFCSIAANLARDFGWSAAQSGVLSTLDSYGFMVGILLTSLLVYTDWLSSKVAHQILVWSIALNALQELLLANLMVMPSLELSNSLPAGFVVSRIFTGLVEGMASCFPAIICTKCLAPFQLAIFGSFIPLAVNIGAVLGPLLPPFAQVSLPQNLHHNTYAQAATALLVSGLLWSTGAIVISILFPLNPKTISSASESDTVVFDEDIASLNPNTVSDSNRALIIGCMLANEIFGNAVMFVSTNALPFMLQEENHWKLTATSLSLSGQSIVCVLVIVVNTAIRMKFGTGTDRIVGVICLMLCVPCCIICFHLARNDEAAAWLLVVGTSFLQGFMLPVAGMDMGYALVYTDSARWYNPEMIIFMGLLIPPVATIICGPLGRSLAISSGRNGVAVFLLVNTAMFAVSFVICRFFLMTPKNREKE